MAINNFKFPGVELTQEFVQTPVTGISTLGVAVVGYQEKRNTTSFVYDGTAVTIDLGSVPYCTAITGDTVTVKVDGVFANYEATSSSTDLAITGSTFTSGKKTATVVFGATVSGATAAFGTLVPEVDDFVDLTGTGTASTTGVITAINGATVTVSVTGATLTGTTVSKVTFYKEVKDAVLEGTSIAEVDEKDILTIPAAVGSKIGGKNTASDLVGTTDGAKAYPLYLEYGVNRLAIGTIGSKDDIRGTFGGLTGDVAIALTFALAAANGNTVDYVCVTSNDTEGYDKAMDFMNKTSTIYSVVPATYNADIIRTCIEDAANISNDPESKVRRVVWYGLQTPASAIKDTLIATRKLIGSSYRAQAVWGDTPYYNGSQVPTFALAAAAAGMRAYEPTYRPLSNLGYDFFTLKEKNGLTASELLAMGAEGIWLIANNFEGTPTNLRQVTTAVSNNLNKDEESIVANADSIALTLCHVGEDLVGCSNISPALLKALSDTITGLMNNYLVNLTENVYIGPQLLSWSLDSLYQHPTMLDHIYAVITCDPPKPFNRFVMTLRIV